MKYCYVRVSTDKQEYERQIGILKENGYAPENTIFKEEKFSAKGNSRPVFDELLNELKPGDTLICESLSRLSRSGVIKTLDLISKIVQEKKVNVIIIKENFNLNAGEKPDATTNMLLGIFSVLGQFERDLTSERTKEALRAKKANGAKLGKKGGKYSTHSNYIETIRLQVEENYMQKEAVKITKIPLRTYQDRIRKDKNRLKTKKLNEILIILESEAKQNEQ